MSQTQPGTLPTQGLRTSYFLFLRPLSSRKLHLYILQTLRKYHLLTEAYPDCPIWNYSLPPTPSFSNPLAAAASTKSRQSCPTLFDPIDSSPPGSPVPGILKARTLEWVTISFSNAWKWKWSHSVVSDPQRPHGILLSHKKGHIWVSSNEVDDLVPILLSEVSQKEKYKYLYPSI